MPGKTEVNAVALVRRKKNSRYEFVFRWLLGEGIYLPRSIDKFNVFIRTVKSNRPLCQDGSFRNPGDADEKIVIKPLKYFMVDPPRKEGKFDEIGNETRMFATVPKLPINCRIPPGDSLPEEEGLGACHILDEGQPEIGAYRLSSYLYPHVKKSLQYIESTSSNLSPFISKSDENFKTVAANMTWSFACCLFHPDTQVKKVTLFLKESIEHLSQGTDLGEIYREESPNPFLKFSQQLSQQWLMAACISQVLADDKIRETVEIIQRDKQSIRDFFLFSGYQGIDLIDYWFSSDIGLANCDDIKGSIRRSISEVAGLGFSVGDFSKAQIDEWVSNSEHFKIRINHEPGNWRSHLKNLELDAPHMSALHETIAYPLGGFTDYNGYITAIAIDDAKRAGSSFPLPQPVSAVMDFDLLDSRAGMEDEANRKMDYLTQSVSFSTGDSKIRIKIAGPSFQDSTSGNRTSHEYGFNVYGMWETGDGRTQKFFGEEDVVASLAELKPWLMTRRYSYALDLEKAFLTDGGSTHPVIQCVLEDPPWQPVTPLPRMYDKNHTGKKTTLPSLDEINITPFSMDLRLGMAREKKDTAFFGWDPLGPIDFEWAPEKKRDGTNADKAPQAYRFWVTTVDLFGQESAPEPVLVNDLDSHEVGHLYHFRPQRRTSMMSPPLVENDQIPEKHTKSNPTRGIKFAPTIDGTGILTVTWETPFLSMMGQGDKDAGSTQKRVSRDLIVCHLVIVKRPLVAPVRDLVMTFKNENIPHNLGRLKNYPQWETAWGTLSKEGWVDHEVKLDIPPGTTDTWEEKIMIGFADRGYEYRALLGAEIKDVAKPFWMPSANRKIRTLKKNGDRYEISYQNVIETPRASYVSITDQISVKNTEEPRKVFLKKEPGYFRADPIKPAVGIDRDFVLQKILYFSFKDDSGPRSKTTWEDTEIKLTEGQKALAEAALKRSFKGDSELAGINVLKDEKLSVARKIIALEHEDSNGSAKQTMLVGFRGLIRLAWNYEPFALKPPENNEAETTLYRIYSVRVPWRDRVKAEGYATAKFTECNRIGVTWRFRVRGISEKEGLNAVNKMVKLHQPVLVALSDPNNPKDPLVFGVCLNINPSGEDGTYEFELGLDPEAPSSPIPNNGGVCWLYLAPILWEVKSSKLGIKEIDQVELFLPVGGGPPEAFCWWVTPVSAQGLEAGKSSDRRPFRIRFFDRSIAPDAISDFRVTVPLNNDEHSLVSNNAQEVVWLPPSIRSYENRIFPRVVVHWKPFPTGEKVFILIERQSRKIIEQNNGESFLIMQISPWKVVQDIQGCSESEAIHVEQIDKIKNNWFLGEIIRPDTNTISPNYFLDYKHRLGENVLELKGETGIKLVKFGNQEVASFIDYFGGNSLSTEAPPMDGYFEFQYRLTVAIPIESDPAYFHSLNSPTLLLLSRPTVWSDYVAPETAPIIIKYAGKSIEPIQGFIPLVEFNFESTLSQRAFREKIESWHYKVMVKRFRTSLFQTEPGRKSEEADWEDVGNILILDPKGNSKGIIRDCKLDRSYYDQEIKIQYKILINQVAMIKNNGVIVPRVVRSSSDENGFNPNMTVVLKDKKDSNFQGKFEIVVPSAYTSRELETKKILKFLIE